MHNPSPRTLSSRSGNEDVAIMQWVWIKSFKCSKFSCSCPAIGMLLEFNFRHLHCAFLSLPWSLPQADIGGNWKSFFFIKNTNLPRKITGKYRWTECYQGMEQNWYMCAWSRFPAKNCIILQLVRFHTNPKPTCSSLHSLTDGEFTYPAVHSQVEAA